MHASSRALYWFVTGTLVGLGLLGIASIGLPLLAVGFGMALFGGIRGRVTGFWAALVGFGLIPMFILILNIASAPPPCLEDGTLILPAGVASVECAGPIPSGYYVMARTFGAVALAGLAWPLLQRFLPRR